MPDFDSLIETYASFVWRVLRRHGVPDRELPDVRPEALAVTERAAAEARARTLLASYPHSVHAARIQVLLGAR